MRIPNRDTVEQIKKKYPPGTRIELISMKDPYSPVPPGTRGTVQMVDDAGTIHPKFDNGRTLGIIVGEDEFIVLDSVTTSTALQPFATVKKSCGIAEEKLRIFSLKVLRLSMAAKESAMRLSMQS